MEEDQCWMWTKRKYSLTSSNILASTLKPSYDESWEEQAFSEEQALIWPPRSYSCSFCSREFRSAQALGGHMNVHRRDRARLKQPPSEDDDDHHHIHQNPLTSPNTNPNSDNLDLLASNPKFPPCYDSKSWLQKFDTKKEVEAAEIVSCKRRRITDASSIPLFSKSISEIDNRHHHHHHHDHIKLKMVEFISPCSINEELDLELRLGHSISKGRPGDCYFDLQQKT